MRPNNQNKRSRGRNNNGGRKHSNPLSRNFESNGPDVKVRGNAAHIAEKYVQLARDAQATGDSVMAENYLQHAEHYFRIISAAQAQMSQRNDQPAMSSDDDDDNDGVESSADDTPKRDREEASVISSDENSAEENAAEGEDKEKVERKPRRPRRTKRTADPAAAAAADGPQPELGELPAFLTGGPATSAAE